MIVIVLVIVVFVVVVIVVAVVPSSWLVLLSGSLGLGLFPLFPCDDYGTCWASNTLSRAEDC